MSSGTLQNANSINGNSDWDGFRHYLSLFWHWAWLIVLVAAVAAGSAFFFLRRSTPVYETSTKVLVIAAPSLQTTSNTSSLNTQNLVPTYADLLSDQSMLGEVIQRLKLSLSTKDLTDMLTVNPIVDTSTIQISVQGTDQAQIAQIGNMLVTVFIEKINSLQSDRFATSKENLQNELASIDALLQAAIADENAATDPTVKAQIDAKVVQYRSLYATVLTNLEQARLAEVQATSSVVQIGEAGSAYKQVAPKTLTYTILAGLIGLLLAAGTIFIMDALDSTFKTAEEISHALKLPILGVIYKQTSKDGSFIQLEPRSPASDAFRSLRTNIQYADVDNPIRSIMITSATPGEGKSTISANLAIALAQLDRKVTLIDADFHNPVIHKRMNLTNNLGLITMLGRSPLQMDDILQPGGINGLSVIAAENKVPPNATEILASKKMTVVLDTLLNGSGMVVIDTPPVLPVADARILAPLVDGVLLVVQPGRTTQQTAKLAVEYLHQVKARILGVVINQVDLRHTRYGYYYKDYYHDQSKSNGNGKHKTTRQTAAQGKNGSSKAS